MIPEYAPHAEGFEVIGDEAPAHEGLFVAEDATGQLFVVTRELTGVAELPGFEGFDALRDDAYTEARFTRDYALIVRTQSTGWNPLAPSGEDGLLPEPYTLQFVMLLRRPGYELVWQRQSERLSAQGAAFLGEHGAVTLQEYPLQGDPDRTVVITSDGAEQVRAGVMALSGPDADGWFAARFADVDTASFGYGFAHAGDDAVRPLSALLHAGDAAIAGLIDASPIVGPGVAFHYIGGAVNGQLELVHERPDAATRVALGRAPQGVARLLRGDRAWLVTAFDPADQTELPWLSVSNAGSEVLELNLDAAAAGEAQAEISSVWSAGGDWFQLYRAGAIANQDGWLNAATGAWKAMPEAPAGQRRFATEYCGSTATILPDGRALVPLRDDSLGGVYLEAEDGALSRIGSPIRDAVFVETSVTGGTLQLRAVPRDYTYCPEASWLDVAPEGVEVLVGGETELVRGTRSLVIDGREGWVTLDPSGRFAAVTNQTAVWLHDLDGGEAGVVPYAKRIVTWF